MINKLIELLNANKNVYAWNFKEIQTDSYQLFLIRKVLDMNREVVVKEYEVTVFTKQEVKGVSKIGTSSFLIYPTMDEKQIKDKIEEQVGLCKNTLNKAYSFPKKATLKPIKKDVGFGDYSLKEAAFLTADALFEVDKYDNGYINSAEIFINQKTTNFIDSNGNNFIYTNICGEVELIATWTDRDKEVELYKFFEFNNFSPKFIGDQANSLLLEARNRIKATKTPEISNCKVLLANEYVKEYFEHFIYKTTNDAVYSHVSNYQHGQEIQSKSSKADKITITLVPTLKDSTLGAPFDDEGIVLKKLEVMEKGVVKNFSGSNAKSQYVGKPVNGRYKNFIVNSGTLTKEELEEENYVEIVSLSGFDIDYLTGNFGSEIRLAYLHQKNKEVQIITGGSVSGNIYESIDSVRFSNNTVQHNNYVGPEKVLLDKVQFNSGM